jgi:hypothetical protein
MITTALRSQEATQRAASALSVQAGDLECAAQLAITLTRDCHRTMWGSMAIGNRQLCCNILPLLNATNWLVSVKHNDLQGKRNSL